MEQQLKQNVISKAEAEKERIRIGENYQRYLNLISQMAERYATTDYDGISNVNKLIMQCIEEGELERADSLLSSKGDFGQREAELLAQEQITKKAEDFVRQSQQVLELKRNDLAQDYYNKHSILMGNYQNDSAAYYMERRCMLDTTKVEWMIEAGTFINDYLADYPRSIRHFRHARNISIQLYGERSLQVATCDNLIGKSLLEQGLYSKSMEHLLKAKTILDSLDIQGTKKLSECYANMAAVYFHVEELPYLNGRKALEQAMKLTKEIEGDTSLVYAKLVTMNAELLTEIKGSSFAIQEMYRVQKIYESHQGTNLMDRARNYSNLGVALSNTGEYEKGRDYIQQAMAIWRQQYGEHHPFISYAYGALADSYAKQKAYQEADSLYNMALSNQKQIFGESHPYIADCYIEKSKIFRKQGRYGEAVYYGIRALDVLLKSEEYSENRVISLLQSIDSWLHTLKVTKHFEEEALQLMPELKRLSSLYNTSSSKKVRLKKIRI